MANLLEETFKNKTIDEISNLVEWLKISVHAEPNFEKEEYDLEITIVLKPNYSKAELEQALIEMNLDYNDGFGAQEVFGNIMFKDGTWLTRREYDGSEWWEHVKPPKFNE